MVLSASDHGLGTNECMLRTLKVSLTRLESLNRQSLDVHGYTTMDATLYPGSSTGH